VTERARRAVVAIDVGGTSLKAGILGPSGCPVLRRVPSGRDHGPDAVLDNTAAIVEALVDECGALGLAVVGIGVAVPGIVDEHGVGLLSVTMGWRGLPVRRRLAERLGRSVTVGHDVRTAAVAETSLGAAAGARSALFVPIGTGIAAAVVIGGVIHAGSTFRSGEIGQIPSRRGRRSRTWRRHGRSATGMRRRAGVLWAASMHARSPTSWPPATPPPSPCGTRPSVPSPVCSPRSSPSSIPRRS
jgi:predicted NBD/HSP70 family sugar kinase